MSYEPFTWVDRVALGDNRFTDQNGNTYEFTPDPALVTEVGTAFSASHMNAIEQGIVAAFKSALLSGQENVMACDLDTLEDNKAYYLELALSNYTNAPTVTVTTPSCWVFGLGTTNDYFIDYQKMQIFLAVEGTGAFTCDFEIFARRHVSGTYGNWVQVYPTPAESGTITFTNSTDSNSYLRKSGNVVQLYVYAKPNSSVNDNSLLNSFVTIPSGFRPSATTIVQSEFPNDKDIRLYIQTGGSCNLFNKSGGTLSTSEQIIFNATYII